MDNYFDEHPYDITKEILDNPESVSTYIHLSKINTISDFLNMKAGAKILDCGCGTGFATLFFPLSNLYKFFSIDISNVEIFHAKKYSKQFNSENEWFVGDCFHLPFKDKSFDAAFCVAFLHHIENYPVVLDELVRVAEKIVICEPNKYCPMHWLFPRTEAQIIAGDTKEFSVYQLKKNFRHAGLHNIRWRRINLIPWGASNKTMKYWKKIEDYLLNCYITNIFAGTIVIYGKKN